MTTPLSEQILSSKVKLVVGLGNPGREHEGTRHNIGFAVLDALARRHQVSFSFSSKWNADIAKVELSEGAAFSIMKPRTFMNLSGTATTSYARFFQIAAMETLVVLDDVALSLGKLRLRRSGSAGGQRGLESVLTHFSTEAVPRLRVGVGPATMASSESFQYTAASLSDYVLSRFHREELPHVQEAMHRAVDAIESLQQDGFETAMNRYNTPPISSTL